MSSFQICTSPFLVSLQTDPSTGIAVQQHPNALRIHLKLDRMQVFDNRRSDGSVTGIQMASFVPVGCFAKMESNAAASSMYGPTAFVLQSNIVRLKHHRHEENKSCYCRNNQYDSRRAHGSHVEDQRRLLFVPWQRRNVTHFSHDAVEVLQFPRLARTTTVSRARQAETWYARAMLTSRSMLTFSCAASSSTCLARGSGTWAWIVFIFLRLI